MENKEIQPWWFVVEPYEGESISHFLGRFRRANELTSSGLGKISELGAAIARWGPMKLYKIGQPWQNEHFYCQ
jgi:hypothetical protein